MGKVSGSYPAVILGVSEQVPQDRRPGQHFEQVNMISDPVRGLCRRHGSVNLAEFPVVDMGTTAQQNAFLTDTSGYRTQDFFVGSKEYVLIYRAAARPANSNAPAFLCYNKTDRTFIPTNIGTGTLMTALQAGGVSALTNVGRYLFLGGHTVTPAGNSQDRHWSFTNAGRGAAWVRGGAYSRTFNIEINVINASDQHAGTFSASYTTPTSSYQGVLDTSDIPLGENYQRQVNDRTNAYNSAVTAWIGTASRAIQPQNIAAELVLRLKQNHPDFADAFWQYGSTVIVDFTASSVAQHQRRIREIVVSDGGDGSLFKGVGQIVASVDDLSAYHHHDKTVAVRPKDTGSEMFYMTSVNKSGGVGPGEVTWVEGMGVEYTVTSALAFATVHNNTLYVRGSPAEMRALGLELPDYAKRKVGDNVSSPAPPFMGRSITYLGMFQDRLVIGAGATLFFSKPGDYLNWFRKSVLTIPDDDPVELYAQGSEDDIIRSDVTYDRNMLLFGERQQYVINGKQPFTPATASVISMSAYGNTVEATPIVAGNYAFYAKRNGMASTVHQIQTGVVVDAPESQELTKQLDAYLMGSPVQLAALTSPNTLIFRTTNRHGLYVYSYMDNEAQAQRMFDSWSKWTWNPWLGHCVGISTQDQNVLVFTIRQGKQTANSAIFHWWVACDEFSMNTQDSDKPYLDSMRPYPEYGLSTRWMRPVLRTEQLTELYGVYGQNMTNDSPSYLLGTGIAGVADLIASYPSVATNTLWVGMLQDCYVEPTNPYIRDQNDRAIVNGRLTLTRYLVSVVNTGGLEAYVSAFREPGKLVTRMNGRLVGNYANQVGRQPVVDTAVSVPIGREVRDFRYRLSAMTWLPLTITAIEWVGQYFYNARRI